MSNSSSTTPIRRRSKRTKVLNKSKNMQEPGPRTRHKAKNLNTNSQTKVQPDPPQTKPDEPNCDDESGLRSSQRQHPRASSPRPIVQLDPSGDQGNSSHGDLDSGLVDNGLHQPLQDRSPSIAYSFGTPSSAWASPIRDPDLISRPILPHLDAVLRDVVEDINTISEQDKRDLKRIIDVRAAAAKLRMRAETLRAALRGGAGNRERLERYVSAWRDILPGWSLLDIYEGVYDVEANAAGEILEDAAGRPREVDIDEERNDRVPAFDPVEASPLAPPQFLVRDGHNLSEGVETAGGEAHSIRSVRKRPGEDFQDVEEEARYQGSPRSPSFTDRLTVSETISVQVDGEKQAASLSEKLPATGEMLRSLTTTIPQKRRLKTSKFDDDHVRYRKRRRVANLSPAMVTNHSPEPRTSINMDEDPSLDPTPHKDKGKTKATDADFKRWAKQEHEETSRKRRTPIASKDETKKGESSKSHSR